MQTWAFFLRAVGLLLLIISVVHRAIVQLQNARMLTAGNILFNYLQSLASDMALVVLCFAVASGLVALDRMEHKINRATASRRRSMPSPQQQRGEDLAPVAPDWEELKLGIHPAEQEKRLARSRRMGTDDVGGLYENVVAHGVRVDVPNVREAPPPVRVTPGTEDQYHDTPATQSPPPSTSQHRRSGMVPHRDGVDRELLRQARDKQIRERQAEQQKKMKPRER